MRYILIPKIAERIAIKVVVLQSFLPLLCATKQAVSCSKNEVYSDCCNGCGHFFTSSEELKMAVEDFRSNSSSATQEYGFMNCWDVSSITDMTKIFYREEAENSEDAINEPIQCWN